MNFALVNLLDFPNTTFPTKENGLISDILGTHWKKSLYVTKESNILNNTPLFRKNNHENCQVLPAATEASTTVRVKGVKG